MAFVKWSLADCLARGRYALEAEGYRIDWSGGDVHHGVKGPHSTFIMCDDGPTGSVVLNIVVNSNASVELANTERSRLDERLRNPPTGGTGGRPNLGEGGGGPDDFVIPPASMAARPGNNARLLERQRIFSPGRNYFTDMQKDGNLVLYRGSCASSPYPGCSVWSSGTNRADGQYYMAMQDDGNLVIYRGRPPDTPSMSIWSSGTFGATGNYFLAVQDDGKIVIRRGTGPRDQKEVIWSKP